MSRLVGYTMVVLAVTGTGCKKKHGELGAAATGGAAKSNLPALTADPDPGTITPKDMQPFESVKFRMLGQRDDAGWPKWDLYNLGSKPIEFVAIYAYAYDASGKQLAMTTVPMSWNGKLDPGGKSDFPTQVGGDPLTADAVSFDACYSAMKYTGSDDQVRDTARCPDHKPKNK